MAQKVHIVLEDDLDGSDATQTVTFGLDGTSYEIDLNDKNAASLRDAMANYVGHARKVSGSRRGRRSSASPATATARRRSATGPAPTAARSPSAAGSRPPSGRPSKPRTELTLLNLEPRRVDHWIAFEPRSRGASRRAPNAGWHGRRRVGCSPSVVRTVAWVVADLLDLGSGHDPHSAQPASGEVARSADEPDATPVMTQRGRCVGPSGRQSASLAAPWRGPAHATTLEAAPATRHPLPARPCRSRRVAQPGATSADPDPTPSPCSLSADAPRSIRGTRRLAAGLSRATPP